MNIFTTTECRKAGDWLRTFAAVSLIVFCMTNPLMAEESLIITLHEEIGRGVDDMKQGFEQLATQTPAMVEAETWANRARELPVNSQEYSQARAQYVASRSHDLEYRATVVKQTYDATSNLTDLIDRLIKVQAKSISGENSVLGGDTEDIIRKKAATFQGVDRMLAAMIRNGDDKLNKKVKIAQQAFQVKMQAAIRMANMKTATGVEKLTALRNTTEGLAYLMRAYADGLELQQYSLTFIAVHGQADMVFHDASEVIEEALAMLDTNSFDSANDDFFMDGIGTGSNEVFVSSEYRGSLVDSIESSADNLISRQQ